MEKKTIGTLQVIFKIVERCNLNCSYCYYYSGADAKTDLRPVVISEGNIEAVADFLVQACLDLQIENLSIIFHGGEPTLLKPALFDWACVFLAEKTKGLTQLRFSMQTNGLHLPEIWLDLIEKHHISVGVSLDGSSEYNDIYRLDHMGRGSHQRISRNIVRLNERFAEGRIDPVGLVSVLNHAYDYKEIYRHFTEDLGVKFLNFLLPDRNRDASDEDLANIDSYGDVLCTLFDEWLEAGQSSIKIRQFEELLRHFSGKFEFMVLPKMYITNQIIVIHTDGHIAIDDTLMPTMSWYRETQTTDVRSTSLKEWLSQRVFNDIRGARSTLPAECVDCRWSGKFVAVATSKTALVKQMVLQEKVFTVGLS